MKFILYLITCKVQFCLLLHLRNVLNTKFCIHFINDLTFIAQYNFIQVL